MRTSYATLSRDAKAGVATGTCKPFMARFFLCVAATALLFFWSGTAMSAQMAASHAADLPKIDGPLPDSPTSYAFNAAAHTRMAMDLSKKGYVEEEYFQSGVAQIYEWPAAGKLDSLGSGPYVTRILVRRPRDRKRFNGAVIVEPFNPSHMVDVDLMWIYSHEYFMDKGYAWVGVTVKPVSGAALKRFNPERYARISFANPLPEAQRCADLELGPKDTSSDLGLGFDILSQLGTLLRSDAPPNPLHGYSVTRVYMTGYSQTAGYTRSYAIAMSPFVKRAGGKNIYDGYLEGGQGPFNVPLNGCEKTFKPGDPRLLVGPVGVPFMDVAGEGDTLVTNFMRRPDSDKAPDLFRRYEISGSTHSGSWVNPLTPVTEDFLRAGGFYTRTKGCNPENVELSDFPLGYILNAMWQNFDDWVVKKIPPPHSGYLTLTQGPGKMATVKDKYGNAVGGVRTTAVDVPVATWHSSREGASWCMRVGYSVPFDKSMLKTLYPTHEDYVQKVTADAEKLRAGRWLTPKDAESIIAEAKNAPIP